MKKRKTLPSLILMSLWALAGSGYLEAASGTPVKISTGDGTRARHRVYVVTFGP
jgi:hypothetical protein